MNLISNAQFTERAVIVSVSRVSQTNDAVTLRGEVQTRALVSQRGAGEASFTTIIREKGACVVVVLVVLLLFVFAVALLL